MANYTSARPLKRGLLTHRTCRTTAVAVDSGRNALTLLLHPLMTTGAKETGSCAVTFFSSYRSCRFDSDYGYKLFASQLLRCLPSAPLTTTDTLHVLSYTLIYLTNTLL
jgi:hypothetical protein